MRVCHCTGYLNNPGGVCCKDLPQTPTVTTPSVGTHKFTPTPLTEEELRRIIREEIARTAREERR